VVTCSVRCELWFGFNFNPGVFYTRRHLKEPSSGRRNFLQKVQKNCKKLQSLRVARKVEKNPKKYHHTVE
jgi:hypothetical protein